MKIAVLLSGGVDSSVALKILKDEGHDLTAFYLKIWLEDDVAFLGECPWEDDLKYARAVCEKLDVPLEVIPLQREYYEKVVSYTISELKMGHTPSPDLFCNQRIKFGAFLEKIDPSYELIATGHYARIEKDGDSVLLKTAPDPVKDQTYFLSHLSRQQIKKALFPIGKYLKAEVRGLAEKFDLPTKSRRDSQGICFLGKIKFKDFAMSYLGKKPGEIVEYESGKILGPHEGFWNFTIGQRTGLGLSGGPWYVVKKDIDKNIVFVSHQFNFAEKAVDRFRVGQFNWINEPPSPNSALNLRVKLRHGPVFDKCLLTITVGEKGDAEGIVKIEEKDSGIAPGQFAVFYDDDVCLGCGRILESIKD